MDLLLWLRTCNAPDAAIAAHLLLPDPESRLALSILLLS